MPGGPHLVVFRHLGDDLSNGGVSGNDSSEGKRVGDDGGVVIGGSFSLHVKNAC